MVKKLLTLLELSYLKMLDSQELHTLLQSMLLSQNCHTDLLLLSTTSKVMLHPNQNMTSKVISFQEDCLVQNNGGWAHLGNGGLESPIQWD